MPDIFAPVLGSGGGVEWILKLAAAGDGGPCVDIMEISKPDDLGDIVGPLDFHDVPAPPLALGADINQPQNPGHAFPPRSKTDLKMPAWREDPKTCGSPSVDVTEGVLCGRTVRLAVTMFLRSPEGCQLSPETLRSSCRVRRQQGEFTIAS